MTEGHSGPGHDELGSNNTRHARAHRTGFAGRRTGFVRGIHEIHHRDTEITEKN